MTTASAFLGAAAERGAPIESMAATPRKRARAAACCKTPRADDDDDEARSTTTIERALTRKFSKLAKLENTKPTVMRPESLATRRAVNPSTSANARWRAANAKLAAVRRMTTTTSERLAAMLTERVGLELASESEREARLESGNKALDARLGRLGMTRVPMVGDGNCQFRALAANALRDQERHAEIRELATTRVEERREDFEIYFDGPRAFDKWLREMKRDRTWGDELTLRAACDALGQKIHCVQSTQSNWYLLYEPEELKSKRMCFISYVSPVHYDAIAEKAKR